MNKEELKREKEILETKVADLLWKFEEKAGLNVRAVSLDWIEHEGKQIPEVDIDVYLE
jgi:hypothetical protein